MSPFDKERFSVELEGNLWFSEVFDKELDSLLTVIDNAIDPQKTHEAALKRQVLQKVRRELLSPSKAQHH